MGRRVASKIGELDALRLDRCRRVRLAASADRSSKKVEDVKFEVGLIKATTTRIRFRIQLKPTMIRRI